VVAVVAAPEGHPLAQQVGLLVVVLARADHEDRIRPALLAQLEHPGADLVERLVPADALVLAVHQLHRVLQAELAVAVLAHRRALGAMRAQVDGRVEHRLLTHPDAVLDHGVDRAAHRAVAADGALDLDLLRGAGGGLGGVGGLGLA
jgi:hypothetical protein